MTSPHVKTKEGFRRISIDPVTRLEGHGKIDIFLDQDGNVADCFFQVPELRGFEKFCEGRPVEELPRITPRICGVCPEAHMMASAKACDAVYGVDLPLTARMLREVQELLALTRPLNVPLIVNDRLDVALAAGAVIPGQQHEPLTEWRLHRTPALKMVTEPDAHAE
jgi:hypothetical protein